MTLILNNALLHMQMCKIIKSIIKLFVLMFCYFQGKLKTSSNSHGTLLRFCIFLNIK